MAKQYATQTKVEVAVLKNQMQNITLNVGKITDTHLPRLEEKVDKVGAQQAYYAGALAAIMLLAQLAGWLLPLLMNSTNAK